MGKYTACGSERDLKRFERYCSNTFYEAFRSAKHYSSDGKNYMTLDIDMSESRVRVEMRDHNLEYHKLHQRKYKRL